jgi:hypothetical protein
LNFQASSQLSEADLQELVEENAKLRKVRSVHVFHVEALLLVPSGLLLQGELPQKVKGSEYGKGGNLL